jgi:hypothetical protein
MIVKPQADAQLPGRARARAKGHDKRERAHQMRRDAQQNLALGERLAHQPQPPLFEIAQAAVDELAAGHGRRGRQIVLFHQHDIEPAAGGVPRDARAVDATAHHQQIATLWNDHRVIFA